MKNLGLVLKAVVLTPLVLASSWLIIIFSYLLVPILVVASIFTVLKVADEYEEDNED